MAALPTKVQTKLYLPDSAFWFSSAGEQGDAVGPKALAKTKQGS